MIDSIYILTTKVRSDRLELIKNGLYNSNPWKVFPDANIEVVYGYHHTQVDLDFLRQQGYDYYEGWELDKSVTFPRPLHPSKFYGVEWDWWYRPMRLGEMCCGITHLSAWKAHLNDGNKCSLFLEDDANLRPGCFESIRDHLMKIPSYESFDWSMFYCDRNGFEVETETIVNDSIVVPNFSYNMHAYVLTELGATQLVNGNYEKNLIINDEYVPVFFNHPRKLELSKVYNCPEVFEVYSPYESRGIINAYPKNIYGSDTEDSKSVVWN